MSCLFSQALVEAYSEDISSDGKPSAPLKSNPSPQVFSSPGRTTAPSAPFPSGMTFALLTAQLGGDILTWFREDFLAKTSASRVAEQEWTESEADSGVRWNESLAKWNPLTSS